MSRMILPDVSSRHGAPMGRRSDAFASFDFGEKIQLGIVPLDRGGYDRGGAYWGLGTTLWRAMDADGATAYFRSPSREQAKAHIRDGAPGEDVRFYR